jgi:hypothetical protein
MNPINPENNENKSDIMKNNPSNDSELTFQIYLFVINHDDIGFKESIKPNSNYYHKQ